MKIEKDDRWGKFGGCSSVHNICMSSTCYLASRSPSVAAAKRSVISAHEDYGMFGEEPDLDQPLGR